MASYIYKILFPPGSISGRKLHPIPFHTWRSIVSDFTFESLSSTISVCVSPQHKFGTDAFLLADFAAPRRKDRVVDLGTGCGIIPFILHKHFKPSQITGVDIQPQAIEQFARGISASQLEGRLLPVCSDLKELNLPAGSFDVITCNPPYKAPGAGILSETPPDQIARHETMCTIEDICRTAARLLRFGGRLCLCQRPERLADVLTAMHSAGIEPKRLRMVAKQYDTAPWLFLVEGKRGSKPFLQVLPTLAVYDGEEFSQEMQKIYGWREERAE